MSDPLARFVAQELDVVVPPEVAALGAALAGRLHGVAVLYYGSTLRTGDLDGVLDFYVLTERSIGTLLRRAGLRWLWPDVSFHEIVVAGRTLRAKVATMPLATFEEATRGASVDTTIWARFVQPAALVWRRDAAIAGRVVRAVAGAAITAARFAAVLGPERGAAHDYWLALFRETYRAELRVEPPGREHQILAGNAARYTQLLPIAWAGGKIDFTTQDAVLTPAVPFELFRKTTQTWLARAQTGKALNVARLIKAAFTFDGAARYGLWKLQRHTGVDLALTPWRERHPILAAPGVLWRVLRTPIL